MASNYFFGPRRTNIPHSTPNYGPRKYNFEVDYHRQIYCSPEKRSRIRRKLGIQDQEVMYYYKCFNYSYIEFVIYETCDKLMWTSGKL